MLSRLYATLAVLSFGFALLQLGSSAARAADNSQCNIYSPPCSVGHCGGALACALVPGSTTQCDC